MGLAAPAGERSPFHSLPSSSRPACPPRGHPSITVSWAPRYRGLGLAGGPPPLQFPWLRQSCLPSCSEGACSWVLRLHHLGCLRWVGTGTGICSKDCPVPGLCLSQASPKETSKDPHGNLSLCTSPFGRNQTSPQPLCGCSQPCVPALWGCRPCPGTRHSGSLPRTRGFGSLP